MHHPTDILEAPQVIKASSTYLDAAARRILSSHGTANGDLGDLIVLVPNQHVTAQLQASLADASNGKLTSMPVFTTLVDWAASVRLDSATTTDSQRISALYNLLRGKDWFSNADLWSMSRELLTLFDELTQSLGYLPQDADAFAKAVQESYNARQNISLHLEARVVFELWHAMLDQRAPDTARTFQAKLAKLASQAKDDLFVLRVSDGGALEQSFLEQYATHANVTVFDLRKEDVFGERGEFLKQVLSAQEAPELKKIAAKCKRARSMSGEIRLFPANSLEQEASAAAMQVRLWLEAGKESIAIVAQDRLAARRLRALLERHNILATDETGWKFSTLSVSTVLDRFLTALSSNFYHQDLLDLMKSPYIFGDLALNERQSFAYRMEQAVRRRNIVSGLTNFRALFESEPDMNSVFDRLEQAFDILTKHSRRTLSGWQQVLFMAMDSLAIDVALALDPAGKELMMALVGLSDELANDDGLYTMQEWRRWLSLQLDSLEYCDQTIASPVRITHLSATRCRKFDAVLLLGCDADHLPGALDNSRWFNDAVRGSLNLQTRSSHTARMRDDLCALLTINNDVLVTWQHAKKGEPNLLSPYLEMVHSAHESVFVEDLVDDKLALYLAAEEPSRFAATTNSMTFATVPKALVPSTVSISGYNSLVACPYQFYARHILRLNEMDDVQEEMEKNNYGEAVHAILNAFHTVFPVLSGISQDELNSTLQQISRDEFKKLEFYGFETNAWLERWLSTVPAYIEWQLSSEKEGWQVVLMEAPFEVPLDGVTLRGRIDRVDVQEGARRVIDYKTQNDQALRDKVREAGEDVQLASYAFAKQASAGTFLSVENGKARSVEPKHDMQQLAALNSERLVSVMRRVRSGDGMPANGIESACQHCEMRGLCRKSS